MMLHHPARPGWTCKDCGLEWPCPPRRKQLLAEYASKRIPLMLYLAERFIEGCEDMPHEPASKLYVRFLRWPHSSNVPSPLSQNNGGEAGGACVGSGAG